MTVETLRETLRERKREYRKTKRGVTTSISSDQRHNSKLRGHPHPTYTSKELRQWLYSQPLFHVLYDEWVISGYVKEKKPSVDRIKDNIPYIMSNIQLMTYGENLKKFNDDKVAGVNRSQNRQVSQYDLEGNLISVFHSMQDASRNTGLSVSAICEVCNGNKDSASGYRWEATERGKYLTNKMLKELLLDERYQDLTVSGFVKALKKQGLLPSKKTSEKAIAKDFIDEKIANLPKDDSPIGSNPFMEGIS